MENRQRLAIHQVVTTLSHNFRQDDGGMSTEQLEAMAGVQRPLLMDTLTRLNRLGMLACEVRDEEPFWHLAFAEVDVPAEVAEGYESLFQKVVEGDPRGIAPGTAMAFCMMISALISEDRHNQALAIVGQTLTDLGMGETGYHFGETAIFKGRSSPEMKALIREVFPGADAFLGSIPEETSR